MPPFLLSPAVWMLTGLALWALLSALRHGRGPARAQLTAVLDSPRTLLFIAPLALLSLTWTLCLDFAAPRDVLQDIVAANELLASRSSYPADMTARIASLMARTQPTIAVNALPTALQTQIVSENAIVQGESWCQAHPPLMTLCVAGPVLLAGPRSAVLWIATLSMLMTGALLLLLRRVFAPDLGLVATTNLLLLLLTWYPVLVTLRTGQSGILLAALLVYAWASLRQGHAHRAGLAVGTAVTLKLWPLTVLFWLLLRHRRAFATATATIAALVTVSWLLCGANSYPEFFATARAVLDEYEQHPVNVSLVGMVLRLLPAELHGPATRVVGLGLWLLAIAAAGVWRWRHRHADLDAGFGLAVLAALLLSPIAWSHYLPVVLAPMAILLSRLSSQRGRPWALFLFAMLALLVSLPEATTPWLVHHVQRVLGYRLAVFLAALPTLGLLLLSIWLLRTERAHATPLRLAPFAVD